MKSKLLIILILISSITTYSSNSSKAGNKAGEFILLGVGARALGMSGAYTGDNSADIFSTYWNPAALAGVKNIKTGFMHNSLPEDITQDYLILGYPLIKNKSYMAISVNYNKYGEEFVTTYINRTGDGSKFDGKDLMLNLSFGYKKSEKWSYGLNLKYLKQDIWEYDANAFAVDITSLVSLTDEINLGFGLYNLGTKIKFIDEEEELPLQLKLGLSGEIFDFLIANGDLVYTDDQNLEYAIGFEFKVAKVLSLRAGFNSVNDAGNGFTLGAGFKIEKFNLDYAYEPFGSDFDNSHKISIDYTFGKIETPKNGVFEKVKGHVEKTKDVVFDSDKLIKEGYNYVLDGEFFYALFSFNEVVQNQPNNVTARLWLAYTNVKIGNIQGGIEEYYKVLQIEPNNSNALQALKILEKK